MNRQQLLTPELRGRLPRLYSQEKSGEQAIVQVKFFGILSLGHWTWYVLEGEPEDTDYVFFGFVSGIADEFGSFRLSELQSLCGPGGQAVELDHSFREGKLTDVVPAPDV